MTPPGSAPIYRRHYEEQKKESNEDEYMHKLCLFMNRKIKFKVCKKSKDYLFVPAAFHPLKYNEI